ncbi:MAG: efflux RND transporter periplasmic adaptor subunit [Planctomycetota bacterium]|nr:efflux RND transporter periplasmic adaptor subunit [Planctomycetota bacterium]
MPIRPVAICKSPGFVTSVLLLTVVYPGLLRIETVSAAEKAEADAVLVKAVAVVQQQVTRTTTQPASIEPYYRAEIRSKLSGYVAQIRVDIGDVVAQGDLLAILSVPEMHKQVDIIKARIRRLQAEERRATAGVALATASIQSATAMLQQSKSQVAMDDAMLKAATAEFDRMTDLVKRGSSEPRLLDEATRRKDAAVASRQSAQSAIVSAEANVVVAESKKAAAEADHDVAKAETEVANAELEELEVMLNYTQLTAPFAGVITSRTVNPGELVSSGTGSSSAAPLFVVSQIDKVRCHLSIPERDAAFVRPGDQIILTFPSFAAEEIKTEVTRTNQSLDRETRTMLVEAEFLNTDGKLLPGMFGQATLSLQAPATVNVLPARAVRFDGKGAAIVYVIREDETIAVTGVTVLADDGQTLQVAGVEPGQRVIDAHLQRFSDGQRVQVLKP